MDHVGRRRIDTRSSRQRSLGIFAKIIDRAAAVVTVARRKVRDAASTERGRLRLSCLDGPVCDEQDGEKTERKEPVPHVVVNTPNMRLTVAEFVIGAEIPHQK